MKTTEIRKLIESFYAGSTSQSDELLLINYFNSNNVPEELLEEKEIFLQLTNQEYIEVPTHLKANLNNLIDKLAEEEAPKRTTLRKQLTLWTSVAASVAIILGIGTYMNSLSIKETNAPTMASKNTYKSLAVTDAEYKQAENAMRLLSNNFNRGMQQLDDMQEKLDKTNKILNETFKQN